MGAVCGRGGVRCVVAACKGGDDQRCWARAALQARRFLNTATKPLLANGRLVWCGGPRAGSPSRAPAGQMVCKRERASASGCQRPQRAGSKSSPRQLVQDIAYSGIERALGRGHGPKGVCTRACVDKQSILPCPETTIGPARRGPLLQPPQRRRGEAAGAEPSLPRDPPPSHATAALQAATLHLRRRWLHSAGGQARGNCTRNAGPRSPQV